MKIDIINLIGEYCITLDDGQQVYDLIHPALDAKEVVELDFTGVEIVASPFLNAAIGQLLRDLQPNDLNAYLKITNLSSIARPMLKQVIDNAKRYYSEPDYRNAVDKVIGAQVGDSDAD
ncbi:MAG: hypothetical protein BroJett018_53550 [Chloroflexota bacterium]|nr:MAG: hypothetical protein BroJett018_53550 [Chloroflexota bacterium]